MTGTTSQLACILTACIWILALPYMSIMTPTPKAVLSSVIVSAVVQSVCIPKDLMNLKRVDFVVGWSTGILTAVTSPTIGFALGLVIFGITYPLRSSDVDKKKKQA
jgi:MFS superfamily sulfate permease-like transporter